MPRSKTISTIILAAGLLAATLGLAACGGGGASNKTPTTAPASTAASGNGGATPASGKTSAATAAPTTSGGSSGGSIDSDLKAAADKFASSTFSADYKITGSLGADITDGSMKLTKKGKDKFRFEITGKQNGEDLSVIFIETPDVSAFCLKNAGEFAALLGIADGEGVCFKSKDDSANPVGSLSSSLKDFENQNVTVLEKSKRTIAGQSGNCFKTQDNDTQEISTACFSGDGAMLYVESAGADAGTIEATSVGKSVSDGDFDPPYALKDAPGFLGGADTPTP